MVPARLKALGSPLLDPIGNRLLSPPACGGWGVHLHGDRRKRQLALTFDDGPVAGGTERVLDVLGEFQVPGTFFCIGVNAQRNPKIIERAVAEGHVIGNHSMQHSRIAGLLPGDSAHFLESEEVLHAILGWRPRLYRSPWGWTAPWEVRRLRSHGLEPIGWDVYTLDWRIPAPNGLWLARGVIRDVRQGSIVLFHDGYTHATRHDVPETVTALRTLIPILQERGYTFVTIPELLQLSVQTDSTG